MRGEAEAWESASLVRRRMAGPGSAHLPVKTPRSLSGFRENIVTTGGIIQAIERSISEGLCQRSRRATARRGFGLGR